MAMDDYSHCADIVRQRDRDRYLADLFAPEPARRHLFALHAFNAEVARIRDVISEPMPGEIRLQWWRDTIVSGEGAGHPVATALNATIREAALPIVAFDNLLKARIFDLYDDPMPSLNDLEGYAGETSSVLMQLGAMTIGDGENPTVAEVAGHAGVAFALCGLMLSLPRQASRGQMFLPTDLAAAHGVLREDLLAGKEAPGLAALLTELRSVARRHLAAARQAARSLPRALLPAFLPVALVEPRLRIMERPGYRPLAAVSDISPWRRQLILWRAARRGLG